MAKTEDRMKLFIVECPKSDYDELHSAVIYAESEGEAREMFLTAACYERPPLEVTEVLEVRGIVHTHTIFG